MSSKQITSKEFWAEVSAIADSVLTEYMHSAIQDVDVAISEVGYTEDAGELEEKISNVIEMIDNVDADDLDDVYDKLHEIIDGHEWVIYTSRSWDVAHLMRGDDNACSMFKEIGYIQSGESLDDLICRFAYCALHSNVTAEMDNAVERWQTGKKAEIETIADNLRRKLCRQS